MDEQINRIAKAVEDAMGIKLSDSHKCNIYNNVNQLFRELQSEREEARVQNAFNQVDSFKETLDLIIRRQDKMVFERYEIANKLKMIPSPIVWIEPGTAQMKNNFDQIISAMAALIKQMENVPQVEKEKLVPVVTSRSGIQFQFSCPQYPAVKVNIISEGKNECTCPTTSQTCNFCSANKHGQYKTGEQVCQKT